RRCSFQRIAVPFRPPAARRGQTRPGFRPVAGVCRAAYDLVVVAVRVREEAVSGPVCHENVPRTDRGTGPTQRATKRCTMVAQDGATPLVLSRPPGDCLAAGAKS